MFARVGNEMAMPFVRGSLQKLQPEAENQTLIHTRQFWSKATKKNSTASAMVAKANEVIQSPQTKEALEKIIANQRKIIEKNTISDPTTLYRMNKFRRWGFATGALVGNAFWLGFHDMEKWFKEYTRYHFVTITFMGGSAGSVVAGSIAGHPFLFGISCLLLGGTLVALYEHPL